MRGSAVVVLAAACAAVVIGAANAGTMSSLLEMDCRGQLHLASQSPFAMTLSGKPLQMLQGQLIDAIKSRAKCACPAISDEEVVRRLVPGMDSWLAFLSGKYAETTDCPDGQNDVTFARSFLGNGVYSKIFGDNYVAWENLLPDTCTYESYRDGGTCTARVVEENTGVELQFAAKSCPNSDQPFISVTCKGELCSNIAKPCTVAGVAGECGNHLKCVQVLTPDDYTDVIKATGLIESVSDLNAGTCDGRTSFIKALETKIASYFPGLTANFVGYNGLNMCLPDDESDVWENAGNNLDSKFNFTDRHMGEEPNLLPAEVVAFNQFKSCNATACPTIEWIGNGKCDPECNTAACKFDGGDCMAKNKADVGCPTSNMADGWGLGRECSGHGECGYPDESDEKQCQCQGNWDLADCSRCTAPPTDPNACDADRWKDQVSQDDAHKTPNTLIVQASGLVAWDGNLEGGGSAASDDRVSGAAFETITTGKTSDEGQELFLFGGDNGFGYNMMNRNLGWAANMHNFNDMLSWFIGQAKDMMSCHAQAKSVSMMSDTNFKVRYLPHLMGWFLYMFTSPTSSHDIGLSDGLGDMLKDEGGMVTPSDAKWTAMPKLGVPSTATFDNWLSSFGAGMEYTRLKSLFGASMTIGMEMKASTENEFGVPSFGMGAYGAVADFFRSPQPCTATSDCASGLQCVDLVSTLSLGEVFEQGKADADPIGNIIFGDNNWERDVCSTQTDIFKTIRKFVLRIGDRVKDDSAELKFCTIDLGAVGTSISDGWGDSAVSIPSTCHPEEERRLRAEKPVTLHAALRFLSEATGGGGTHLPIADVTSAHSGTPPSLMSLDKAEAMLSGVGARIQNAVAGTRMAPLVDSVADAARHVVSAHLTARDTLRRLDESGSGSGSAGSGSDNDEDGNALDFQGWGDCTENPISIAGLEATTRSFLPVPDSNVDVVPPVPEGMDDVKVEITIGGVATVDDFGAGEKDVFKQQVAEALSTASGSVSPSDVYITSVSVEDGELTVEFIVRSSAAAAPDVAEKMQSAEVQQTMAEGLKEQGIGNGQATVKLVETPAEPASSGLGAGAIAGIAIAGAVVFGAGIYFGSKCQTANKAAAGTTVVVSRAPEAFTDPSHGMPAVEMASGELPPPQQS